MAVIASYLVLNTALKLLSTVRFFRRNYLGLLSVFSAADFDELG